MALEAINLETAQKFDGPRVKQFSVFLKNKTGALLEVVRLLRVHTVDVIGLSVQDSTDSSIVRLIVSDPEIVEIVVQGERDSVRGVRDGGGRDGGSGDRPGAGCWRRLLAAEVNIFFSYPLLTRPNRRAALAMHVEDHECAASVLMGDGFMLLSQADISR